MTDADNKEIENKLYWTLGYEAGVELERERIRAALRNHAASRDVFETLANPFHADEIDKVVMEGTE
jgi:hypothetical protein